MLLEKIVYKWSDTDIYAIKLVLENYWFLVYMYYTHPGYETSIFGKSCAYYIRIFTVVGAVCTKLCQKYQNRYALPFETHCPKLLVNVRDLKLF